MQMNEKNWRGDRLCFICFYIPHSGDIPRKLPPFSVNLAKLHFLLVFSA